LPCFHFYNGEKKASNEKTHPSQIQIHNVEKKAAIITINETEPGRKKSWHQKAMAFSKILAGTSN
jgi:hypothetical protein